jgi:hypothetical protein
MKSLITTQNNRMRNKYHYINYEIYFYYKSIWNIIVDTISDKHLRLFDSSRNEVFILVFFRTEKYMVYSFRPNI